MEYVYVIVIIIAIVLLISLLPKRKYECSNCKCIIKRKTYLMNFWYREKFHSQCPYCNTMALFTRVEK